MIVIRALLLLSLVVCSAVSLSAGVHVWTGANSGLFSDAANWRGGSPAGDPEAELVFPGGPSRLALTNDLAGLAVRTLSFSGPGYTIAGAALTLAADADVIDNTVGPTTLATDLVLLGSVTFINGHLASVDGGDLSVSGVVRGTGPLVKAGPGRLTFTGTQPNTYGGGTRVLRGELRLAKPARIDAVPGALTIGTTGINYENGFVTTVADEQIPDTAAIDVCQSCILGIGAVETVGPLRVEAGAQLRTIISQSGSASSFGTLILACDIEVLTGHNTVDFWYDVRLAGMRTITLCDDCPDVEFGNLGEQTPGAGLIVRGVAQWRGIVNVRRGSYRGPTIIEGGRAVIDNPNTAVRLRYGSFSGKVASLIAEGGRISAVTTTGDLRLNPFTTVVLSPHEALLTAGGTLDLGGAKLEFVNDHNVQRILGKTYVVGRNNGPDPIRGTFSRVPEGTILLDRFRVSYVGGNGNDLTLTEIGRHSTHTRLTLDPAYAAAGQAVTLNADVETARRPDFTVSTGQVVFREGEVVLGIAPVSSGEAFLTIHPSWGIHTYTATYEGASDLAPSTSEPVLAEVSPAAATIASVEPQSAQGGTIVEIVLRGTGFLPGGRVTIASNELTPQFVSDTEVRLTWHVPGYEDEFPTEVTYYQPRPGSVRSNAVPFLIKPAQTPPSVLTFETRAVSGPVVPGGGAAWMSIFRRNNSNTFVHGFVITPDTDGDGIVRWEAAEDLTQIGFWLMADMTDGRISVSRGDGRATPPATFPNAMFLRDANGHYSHVMLPSGHTVNVLWVRPGVGAWRYAGADSGSLDLDGSHNGYFVFNTSQMTPVGNSPVTPPAGLLPGDTFAALEWHWSFWFGDRVDSHLAESNGPGTLRFASSSSTIFGTQESEGVARVIVMRTGGTDGEVSLRYATKDGTATAGAHYAPRAGTLTFGPGEILKTIEIPLVDDASHFGPRTFSVVLSDPAGTTISGGTAIDVPVTEDDAPPRLSFTNDTVTVPEGDHGTREAQIVVNITGAFSSPVTVNWGLRLEPYGSYFETGTLTFIPGGPASQTITVRFEGNERPEEDRSYVVELSNPQNAVPVGVPARVSVIDDDFAEITILDATVSETGDRIEVLVTTTQRSDKPISVDYATVGGSATAGSDFTATSGTVELQQAYSTATIVIPILTDGASEGEETFTVVLSNAKNSVIRRATATVVIVDDDTGAVPSISAAPVIAPEGSQFGARFRIGLSFPSTREVRVRAATADGTAAAGTDYQHADQVLVIPPGAIETFLNVPVPNDDVEETSETFTLVLSEAVEATIATPSVLATILDTTNAPFDPNAIVITAEGTSVVEAAGAARFTVRLSRASTSPVTVSWSTADGTAFAPADYTAASGTLTFAPGETVRTIDVAVTNDDGNEPAEAFTLVLDNGAVGTARITDDDVPLPRRNAVRH